MLEKKHGINNQTDNNYMVFFVEPMLNFKTHIQGSNHRKNINFGLSK